MPSESGTVTELLICDNLSLSTTAPRPYAKAFLADGQLIIGAAVAPNMRTGTIAVGSSKLSVTVGPGTISLDAVEANFNINNMAGFPLSVARGGSGRTTFAQGAMMIGNLTNPLNSVQLANGQFVVGTGIGNFPVAASPTNGNNVSWTLGVGTLRADVTGVTTNAMVYGSASGSLTSLGVATNGQIPFGSTGNSPVLAALGAGTNIAITLGAGSCSIAALTGAPVLAYVESSTTPYVVTTANNVIGIDCSLAVKTVHLPNAPATTGTSWTIKDYTGTCAVTPITLTTPGGAVLIDAAATYTMNVAYSSVTVLWTGTKYIII